MNPKSARVPVAALAGLACVAGLTACGSKADSAAQGGSITVEARDDACAVSRTTADAGTLTFEITNKGNRVTEFYLYAEGDRIMGEVENIAPGVTRRLVTEVAAGGRYQTACKPGMQGDGIRADFTVNGGAAKQAGADADLAAAARSYASFVATNTQALEEAATTFVAAVKSGNLDEAKKRFPVARTYYERVEPVAEKFGDLDPAIDVREADLEAGRQFTGFHRLEKDLWVSGLQPDTAVVADKLLADLKQLRTKAATLELTPLDLANGAKELLDEVATGKITGEEDAFSHTDLWDFQANVDGSKAAIQALRPVVQRRDAALLSTVDEKFKAVDTLLAAQRKGDGFVFYNELTAQQIKDFAAAVDALGEPISKVADVVAKQ